MAKQQQNVQKKINSFELVTNSSSTNFTMHYYSYDNTMGNMQEASCERYCDDDWILLEETKPNIQLYNESENKNDNDFLGILRLRQSTNDEASMESGLTETEFSTEFNITSKLTKSLNPLSYVTSSGFLLPCSLLIVFLLSSTIPIYSNTRAFQLFSFHNAPEILVEEVVETNVQQQDQYVHFTPNDLNPQESDQTNSTTETNLPNEELEREQGQTFDWQQWETVEEEQLLQQATTIQNEIPISLPSNKEGGILPSENTFDILDNIPYFLNQMANEVATASIEMAKYANDVFDDLASKSAELRASELSMAGDIWEAAKIMVSGIIRQVSDIVGRVNKVLDDLATKNAEIHSSKLSLEGGGETLMYQFTRKFSTGYAGMQTSDIIDMKGVRESFTKMRSSIRKETSRMLSRETNRTSMRVFI